MSAVELTPEEQAERERYYDIAAKGAQAITIIAEHIAEQVKTLGGSVRHQVTAATTAISLAAGDTIERGIDGDDGLKIAADSFARRILESAQFFRNLRKTET